MSLQRASFKSSFSFCFWRALEAEQLQKEAEEKQKEEERRKVKQKLLEIEETSKKANIPSAGLAMVAGVGGGM